MADFHQDEALVRSWRQLESAASLPTQSHHFARALSSTLLADEDVQILSVSEGEEMVALLASCGGTRPFSRRRMIGVEEVYEPVDALCRNEHAAKLLADAIAKEGRPLQVDRMPVDSPLIPALRTAMRRKGWISVRSSVPTPTIALDDSWKDPSSRFNSGRRSDFRRAARKANALGTVSFELLSPTPAEFDALFDEAVGVEMRSWKKEAETALAVDRPRESFFRAFFRSASERGEFRIAFMRIDGRAIAMQMGLECLGRYWLFKIGFDERFERCSPGTLLMLHTIGWAAQRGVEHYELLGVTEPWIAQLWTRDQHDCVRLRTYPFNIAGAIAFAADTAAWMRGRLGRRRT